jgi:ABC-type transport system involved in multi-copper enzyme maturation permease subunit
MTTLASDYSPPRTRRVIPPVLLRYRWAVKPLLFVLTTLLLWTALSVFKVIPALPPTIAQIQAAQEAQQSLEQGPNAGITFSHIRRAISDSSLIHLVPDTSSRTGRWLASWNTLHWTAWLLIALMAVVRFTLKLGSVPMAVARLTLNDMLRQRLGLWPVAILVILLSLFPLFLTVAQPLRYQLQTFLSYGFLLTAGLLSVLTLLLATRSVSSDMSEGHVATLFTKPMGRLQYLLGKFLGVSLLNVVLVAACTFAIYVTAMSITRGQPQSQDDFNDMISQVLLARRTFDPEPPRPFIDAAKDRMVELERERQIVIEPGPGADSERAARTFALAQQLATDWRAVAPGKDQTFVFSNLQSLKQGSDLVQLRVKGQTPSDPPNKIYPVILAINGQGVVMDLRVGSHQLFPIDPSFIDDSGKLTVTVVNLDPRNQGQTAGRMSLSFSDESSLQLMYPVASFENNFWRPAVVMLWRLVFLSMLGVVAGCLLSFPVAAQLVMTIWIIAAGSSYISDALDYTPSEGLAASPSAIYSSTMLPLLKSATSILGQYNTPDAAALLADGRFVPTSQVVWNGIIIGIAWTLLALVIGFVFFWKKELARVTV